jgi:hypothetical protein
MVDRTSLNKQKINKVGNKDAVECLGYVISRSEDSSNVIIHKTNGP